MGELTLVGLDEDGAHVVLEGPDGKRFRVVIDEALRAAVRRDRPGLEQVRADSAGLSPREIQTRIRAGRSAAEVAEESGMSLDLVRRYEGAVVAEREFVAEQARAGRIGREPDAPVLGELVADRLATREVDPGSITWDAYRGDGPWVVEVRFTVGGSDRSARWHYTPSTRTLRADDDEARWLSETRIEDEPIPRRHLAAVRDGVFDVEVAAVVRPILAQVDPAPVPPEPEDVTAALLDDLAGQRGTRRPPVEIEDDEEDEHFEGFGPQHTFDFSGAAHPPGSHPGTVRDATVLPLGRPAEPHGPQTPPAEEPPEPVRPEPEEPADKPRQRKGRASVPSWDEIVFGAKND